jgi:hypothetical protein
MKKVICVDDSNLPEGAQVIKDAVYEVESEFINLYDQRTYIILGVNNYGTTKMGLTWRGYNSNRFSDLKEDLVKTIKEEEYVLA